MFRALSRQMLLFVLAGVAQVALDWAVFVALTHAGLAVAIGNIIGRTCGAMPGSSRS
jgi:putative flippase GtrA